MKHDDGIVKIYTLTNVAVNGMIPKFEKSLFAQAYFEYRTVGYGRFYAAAGVNMQIDAIVRIWENRNIKNDMIAEIDGDFFRIMQIQHIFDDDYIRVTDLSLTRIEEIEINKDVINE